MEWFIAAVAVVALGVAAVVAAGGGGSMARDPVRDTYAQDQTHADDQPLDAAAVRGLRFGVALRGYAMDQVDTVLDRLARELDARDARIAELSDRGPQEVPPDAGAEPAYAAPHDGQPPQPVPAPEQPR